MFKYLNILSLVLVVSCSTPVEIESVKDLQLQQYKTYDWAIDTTSDAQPTLNDIQLANLMTSADGFLSNKGWRRNATNPEIYIKPDILLERYSQQRTDAVYSDPYYRTFYNPYTGRFVNVYYPSRFLGYNTTQYEVKEGTLTLSLFDARTEKMIWQGWTTTPLNRQKMSESQLTNATIRILKKLPL